MDAGTVAGSVFRRAAGCRADSARRTQDSATGASPRAITVGGAVEPRHQRLQFRLHFEHDLGAGCGEDRHIARELDRVAEPLLGMKQHGLARQRIFAEPQRLAAALLRRHAGAAPAPFVVGETALILAEREQSQRLVEMRVGVILLDRQHFAIAGDGFVIAIELRQRLAAIEPGGRRGRARPQALRRWRRPPPRSGRA